MIIILNDDGVYKSWIRRHRDGFVVATRRKATKRNTTLHRASCDEVRKARSKRTHWTTAGRMKVCSLDRDDLIAWVREQTGSGPRCCTSCEPTCHARPAESAGAGADHLTKLENDIVSAVLESAVIQLDNRIDFEMSVEQLARYLGKTPAQIASALRRLVAKNMLQIEAGDGNGELPPAAQVFPTALSLSTVPAFGNLAADQLRSELKSLHATNHETGDPARRRRSRGS